MNSSLKQEFSVCSLKPVQCLGKEGKCCREDLALAALFLPQTPHINISVRFQIRLQLAKIFHALKSLQMITLESKQQIWLLRGICGKWSFQILCFCDSSNANCRPNFKIVCSWNIFLTFCGQICGKGSNVISRHLFSSWHMVNLIILRSLYNKITVAKLYMYI